MRTPVVALLLALALTGCARKEEAAAPAAEAADSLAREASADHPGRYLAYEHFLQVDAREDKVGPIHDAALAACRAAVAEQCVVLESHLGTGDHVSARLRFRARAAGIQSIIKVLGANGEVTRQTTQAEDLAGPIQDSAKRLAMLQDYRRQLEALRQRAGGDIESLIKVSKELAEVQGQIEALSGERAGMMQRVDTQLLNVTIEPSNAASFWRPVTQAFGDFGRHVAQAIAAAVTFLAYLIPWGVIFLALGWAGRRAWQRWKR